MISRRTFLAHGTASGLSFGPLAFTGQLAGAAQYPNGPVKMIVAQGAGGSLDVLLRRVADQLGRTWGTQIVVLNMPTGSGVVATRSTIAAPPDGQTLFMASASVYTVLPEIQPSLAPDIANFIPIGLTGEQPMAVVVSSSLPVKSLPELIALSKRNADGLGCAVSGRFALASLTGELLRARSGANLNLVYYNGASQALVDVVAGRVPILLNVLPGVSGAIASGQVKLLAITSPKRLPAFPDTPTATETVPDFLVSGWAALVAPKGTPQEIVMKISDDLRAIQKQPEFQKQLEAIGVFTRPMSPDQVTQYIKDEQKVWLPIVRALNAKGR